MPTDNIHPCEHCQYPIDYDQTDTCPRCTASIFASPTDLTDEQRALIDDLTNNDSD